MALVVSSPRPAPRSSMTDETNIQTTSPFESLPAELISLIASHLVPRTFVFRRTSNLGGLLTATHVCQSWRVAISNDPRLWTKIDLYGRGNPQPLDCDLLAKVLTLSGSLSLDITVYFPREREQVYAKMLDLILENSTRCVDISLTVPYDLFVEFVCKDCAFPKLRRLSLTPNPGRNPRQRMYLDTTENLWRRLPELEVLEIMEDMTDYIRQLPPNECFRNLKNVKIEIPDIPGDAGHIFFPFIDMLSSSKTITSVSFESTCCEADSDFLYRDPVGAVNTNIETLHVKNYGVRLLHHMSLPSLRNLSVDTLRWKTDDVPVEIADAVLPYIIRFLDRSSPPLETFTLAEWQLAPSILPSMFHHLRRLTYFSLSVDLLSKLDFLPEFFDELAKHNDGTFAALPHLERLAIRLNADTSHFARGYDERKEIEEIDEEHFVSMVRERTSHNDPSLRYVGVTVDANSYCALFDSDVEILKQYEQRVKGLKVVITDAGWS